ncbi:MAG: hypothetical protein WCP17_03510 [bacterium]
MGMESYSHNLKIKKDGKTLPSELPLNIISGESHAEGGESMVSTIKARNASTEKEVDIVLKENKRESFATDEEMQESKKFYEFLKNFPGFGKFVPDTLYFKARDTREDTPKAFCIQKFAKGERIDRLNDDAIYKDPVVVRQLLELAEASIKLLQTVRKEDTHYPDFMRTPELNKLRVMFGATIFNPRYSSNIIIADKPDKNGQQVFFVDVGVNANARMHKGWEWNRRHAVGSVVKLQFNAWKKKLEEILAKQ